MNCTRASRSRPCAVPTPATGGVWLFRSIVVGLAQYLEQFSISYSCRRRAHARWPAARDNYATRSAGWRGFMSSPMPARRPASPSARTRCAQRSSQALNSVLCRSQAHPGRTPRAAARVLVRRYLRASRRKNRVMLTSADAAGKQVFGEAGVAAATAQSAANAVRKPAL